MVFKTSTAVAVLLAAVIASPASAQEKTPASAYEFIRSNMGDGSWGGEYEFCDDIRDDDTCYINNDARITGVYYEYNTYCYINFIVTNENGSMRRIVDLRKSFTIGRSYPGIYFSGPVGSQTGKIYPQWQAIYPSFDIAERVVAALNYLSEQCRPKSAW